MTSWDRFAAWVFSNEVKVFLGLADVIALLTMCGF